MSTSQCSQIQHFRNGAAYPTPQSRYGGWGPILSPCMAFPAHLHLSSSLRQFKLGHIVSPLSLGPSFCSVALRSAQLDHGLLLSDPLPPSISLSSFTNLSTCPFLRLPPLLSLPPSGFTMAGAHHRCWLGHEWLKWRNVKVSSAPQRWGRLKQVHSGRNLQLFQAVNLLCEMCKLQSLCEALQSCFQGFLLKGRAPVHETKIWASAPGCSDTGTFQRKTLDNWNIENVWPKQYICSVLSLETSHGFGQHFPKQFTLKKKACKD